MSMHIEDLEKVTTKEGEVLFLHLSEDSTEQDMQDLADEVGKLDIGKGDCIVLAGPLDIKKMSKEDAQALLNELKAILEPEQKII